VLWGYLWDLFVPGPGTAGLFRGDLPISRGLFDPWSTFWGWLGLAGLAALAFRVRARAPLFSLGIAFFLAGHLLESTIIPLEPAFEHRNYLPSIFLFLFPAKLLLSISRAHLRIGMTTALLLMLAVVTGARADLWGKPFQQALAWAQAAPDSPRGQVLLSQRWLETGNGEAARVVLSRTVERHPSNRIFSNPPSTDAVVRYQLEQALTSVMNENCRGLGPETARRWIEKGLHGSRKSDPLWRRMLLVQRGASKLREGDIDGAYRDFLAALNIRMDEEAILSLAARLASGGGYRQALELLDDPAYGKDPVAVASLAGMRRCWLRKSGYYERERRALRETIANDERVSSSSHVR